VSLCRLCGASTLYARNSEGVTIEIDARATKDGWLALSVVNAEYRVEAVESAEAREERSDLHRPHRCF